MKNRVRELGEQIDAHRKRQQTEHPTLTLTGTYNVLEKLREGEALSKKEKTIHEQGLVSVLRQLHDDLDSAVFEAYGWPNSLSDDEILERLVVLNIERAGEEAKGTVRWLRPEVQHPEGREAAKQETLGIEEPEEAPTVAVNTKAKVRWPKTLAEQAQVLRTALAEQIGPVTAQQLARCFSRARVDRVEELLDTLASLGQARELTDGRYVSPLLGTESRQKGQTTAAAG